MTTLLYHLHLTEGHYCPSFHSHRNSTPYSRSFHRYCKTNTHSAVGYTLQPHTSLTALYKTDPCFLLAYTSRKRSRPSVRTDEKRHPNCTKDHHQEYKTGSKSMSTYRENHSFHSGFPQIQEHNFVVFQGPFEKWTLIR